MSKVSASNIDEAVGFLRCCISADPRAQHRLDRLIDAIMERNAEIERLTNVGKAETSAALPTPTSEFRLRPHLVWVRPESLVPEQTYDIAMGSGPRPHRPLSAVIGTVVSSEDPSFPKGKRILYAGRGTLVRLSPAIEDEALEVVLIADIIGKFD